MNRNRMVASAIGLVVGAGAIGWIAGTQIMSPAEAAAHAQAPAATLITVAVEERVLSADIIARGTIDYDDPVSLSLSGSMGDPEAKTIITMIPAEGTILKEGSVALEVAGRPVILLQGDIAVYRDMRPGSSGIDVEQLETALVRLGFLKTADSTWDTKTGSAIQALYAAVGYTANATSDSEAAALKSARESVRYASQALSDAENAIATAGQVSGSSLLEAQGAVEDATNALKTTTIEQGVLVAAAEGTLTSAENDLTAAQGRTPPPPQTELDVLNKAVADAQGALSIAQAKSTDAISSANYALMIDNARLTELQAPGDLTSLNRARDAAKRDLQAANEELVKIEARVGTWLPSGEIIFLKALPVQVARLSAARGDIVSGSFMTVSGAEVAMTIGLQESDAKRLAVGDMVIVDEPDLLPEQLEAAITEIPEAGSSGRVQVKVGLASIPPELLGANVRVIIPVESTAGEVLVVPAAALSAVANGDTRVEVEDPDHPGTTRFVTVVTGLATDGVVEVRPVDGTLVAGDRVVVGQADIGPAGSDEPTPAPTNNSISSDGSAKG